MYCLLLFMALTITTLSGLIQQLTNWYFSSFSQKTGFGISCKLSPLEIICMKSQSLFSWKNKTYFSMPSAENITHSA